jgi:predicted nuclease of predicted toxin-antitoxin system
VKLLFDENLAPRLVGALKDLYPGSIHVRAIGLKSAPDSVVWEYAAKSGYAIVSKDADFRQRSFLFGHPPKVIWVRTGNCSTEQIERLLRSRVPEILAFGLAEAEAFLSLA